MVLGAEVKVLNLKSTLIASVPVAVFVPVFIPLTVYIVVNWESPSKVPPTKTPVIENWYWIFFSVSNIAPFLFIYLFIFSWQLLKTWETTTTLLLVHGLPPAALDSAGSRVIHVSEYCCHKLKVISNSLTGNTCTSVIFWPLFLKWWKRTI